MFRALFVSAALFASAPAFACGGDKPCDKSHCKMQVQDEVAKAMAAVDDADGDKVSFAVKGMTCGSCANNITAKLTAVEGVNAAAVSHAEGMAKIAFDGQKTNIDALLDVVNGMGKFKAEKAES